MEWLNSILDFVKRPEIFITLVTGLFLGFIANFLYPMIRDKAQEKKNSRKREIKKDIILKELDEITDDVMLSVKVDPHGVENKDKWILRLQQFADRYDDMLGNLAGYVRRISYKIDDSTFDHASLGDRPYCCDEVEIDLTLLKLSILPRIVEDLNWSHNMIMNEERKLLWKLFVNMHGTGPFILSDSENIENISDVQDDDILNKLHEQWRSRKFRIDKLKNIAMIDYVNHERSRSYA